MQEGLRIGVDVGGTNTDAVLLDGSGVAGSAKVATTADVNGGIAAALRRLEPARAGRDVRAVIIGTTHFMNALVQARDLAPVACIRLATPPQTIPPFTQWPPALAGAVKGRADVVAGGVQYNGAELAPLDEAGLVAAARAIRDAGIGHVVVSAVFSPVEASPEQRARDIVAGELGAGCSIVLSSEIGRIGILERENAAILNASMLPLARRVVDGFAALAAGIGPGTAVYVSQNDGTLMSLDMARTHPILTVSSGPTNSIRGAASLSGESDAVVVDIGGTTTDVGLLQHGFPRDSVVSVEFAGVRTNFRIPDVTSIGIGGGSLVSLDGDAGPASVGHRLESEALVFGGSTLTLTDVAVAAGLADIGDRAAVASLPTELVSTALARVGERLAAAVTAARVSPEEIPTVIVGGGAFLGRLLHGVPGLLEPPGGEVANAIGAALAQASGSVDSVYSLAGTTRNEVLDTARERAVERAIDAGAVPSTVTIIDEVDVPLTHLPGGTATRVRIKAIGELLLEGPDL